MLLVGIVGHLHLQQQTRLLTIIVVEDKSKSAPNTHDITFNDNLLMIIYI